MEPGTMKKKIYDLHVLHLGDEDLRSLARYKPYA